MKLTINSYNLFRYFLGTFHGSVHFQLLTGINLGYQHERFMPIFLAITILLSGVSFLSVNLKKMKERYQDRKFLQNININIVKVLPSGIDPFQGILLESSSNDMDLSRLTQIINNVFNQDGITAVSFLDTLINFRGFFSFTINVGYSVACSGEIHELICHFRAF